MPATQGAGTPEPSPEDSSGDKPGVVKPSLDKSGLVKPSLDKSDVVKPGLEKPGLEKPSLEKPGADEPAAGRSGAGQESSRSYRPSRLERESQRAATAKLGRPDSEVSQAVPAAQAPGTGHSGTAEARDGSADNAVPADVRVPEHEPVSSKAPMRSDETASAGKAPDGAAKPAEEPASPDDEATSPAEQEPVREATSADELVTGDKAVPGSQPVPADDTASAPPAQVAPVAAAAAAARQGQAPSAEAEAEASSGGDMEVAVVPGITRYHRADCLLIRFLTGDDLDLMSRQAARNGGCVPCKACKPDQETASAAVG